jgi:hypothetical protein
MLAQVCQQREKRAQAEAGRDRHYPDAHVVHQQTEEQRRGRKTASRVADTKIEKQGLEEIVSAVEAVLEFGEVAGYMLVADGAVSASDGALDVAEGGVDPLAGFRAALRPDPVMIGWWTQPALPTPVKQCRPSLTTVLAGWKLRCAKGRDFGTAQTLYAARR